jgi:hypothetical protein
MPQYGKGAYRRCGALNAGFRLSLSRNKSDLQSHTPAKRAILVGEASEIWRMTAKRLQHPAGTRPKGAMRQSLPRPSGNVFERSRAFVCVA